MNERPILFSAPMVRALLAGTKTQTRRPAIKSSRPGLVVPCDFDAAEGMLELENTANGTRHWKPCPYGKPGDRLWVRENGWERPERTPKMLREGADTWAPYYYDADGILPGEADDFKRWGFKRRPSIHMPRAACRLVLEVAAVRVNPANSPAELPGARMHVEEQRIPTAQELGIPMPAPSVMPLVCALGVAAMFCGLFALARGTWLGVGVIAAGALWWISALCGWLTTPLEVAR